ncbi:MAG: DoxX family protein [Pirellulales bacterium]
MGIVSRQAAGGPVASAGLLYVAPVDDLPPCCQGGPALATSSENCCPLVKSGVALAAALLLLRLCIGFHFFKEGSSKLADPKPFSAMFFGAAKGPLAPKFHALVWDADGRARLDADQTVAAWGQFVERAKTHYGFDADQVKLADEKLARREGILRDYLGGMEGDLKEYFQGLERREANRAEPARMEVPSLRGQSEKFETELKAKRGPWLAEIDKLGKDLENDMLDVATPQQRTARGTLAVLKPGRRTLDSETMDRFIPYFDLTIGILLLIGLFTRAASLVAAGFLASVVATQWPGSYGAMPTYYQAAEMCGLLVLAAANAGRCGGLDSVVAWLYSSCCRTRKTNS